jgi:hypothetical protein
LSKEETVIITLGIEPAESGCSIPWAAVFVQDERKRELTGKDIPETSNQQVALSALLGDLSSEHVCEKCQTPDDGRSGPSSPLMPFNERKKAKKDSQRKQGGDCVVLPITPTRVLHQSMRSYRRSTI